MRIFTRALLLAPFCGAFLLAQPAFAQKTKADLNTEVGVTFPDNIVGAITPLGVRTFQSDLINSIMPTAPVVSGNLTCFDGITGLLKDCGLPPTGAGIAIGSSPITSGSTGRVLYDNAGLAGEYPITGSAGNVVMSSQPTITNPIVSGASPSTTAGMLGYTGQVLNWFDGGAIRTAVAVDLSQTLTNKTINGANNTLTVRISNDVSGLGTGIASALSVNVGSAGAPVLFNGAGGTPASLTLTNATGLPIAGITGLGTGVGTALANTLSSAGGVTSTIASGATALGTGAISSATCATVVTATATNATTSDVLLAGFSADPTSTTGYLPSVAGMLTIVPWLTANTANFKVCNNTAASITPGAVTLNWRVVR